MCNLHDCLFEGVSIRKLDDVTWQFIPKDDRRRIEGELIVICSSITKTRLYNFDPLKPHFYIVKLGFTGVYIIFLMFAQSIDCGYSLEPPRRGGSNEYPQSMF